MSGQLSDAPQIASAPGGAPPIAEFSLDSEIYRVTHQRALEAMAQEASIAQVLNIVCVEIERVIPDITASVLMLDEKGFLQPLAGPSLPSKYVESITNLQIGPKAGSCGTAAYRGEEVWSSDIATDPLWEEGRDHVLGFGYVACWSTPILAIDGRVAGTFAFYYRKVTEPNSFQRFVVTACVHLCMIAFEREQTRLRMQRLAFYDGLTELPNRALLLKKAEQQMAAAVDHGAESAVLLVSLDRFKQINDSLGYVAGDRLLCTAARRIETWLSSDGIVGKLSGDKFAAFLSGFRRRELLTNVMRLQQMLSEPYTLGDNCVVTSASVGIAISPIDGRDVETLFHRAEMAMYQAKAVGPGRYNFFNHAMSVLVQENLALEADLRDALRTESLRLYYQPQINIESGQLYGVEALVRWPHPSLGMLPPSRFVPLAQECGLIVELGHWALREACRQLSRWRVETLAIPSISINLSATSFHDLDLPRTIAKTLAEYDLLPQDLMLEITEGVFLDTHPSILKTINQLNAQGVRLSMDDFGTGYSSLGCLRRLPTSEIKLDRSFVRDLAYDPAARALSAAILGISRSLNLVLVAEGVETEEQLRILTEQGYTVIQGYFFSPALQPSEFANWAASWMQCGAKLGAATLQQRP